MAAARSLTVVAAKKEGSLHWLQMKLNTRSTWSLCGDSLKHSCMFRTEFETFPVASFIHV